MTKNKNAPNVKCVRVIYNIERIKFLFSLYEEELKKHLWTLKNKISVEKNGLKMTKNRRRSIHQRLFLTSEAHSRILFRFSLWHPHPHPHRLFNTSSLSRSLSYSRWFWLLMWCDRNTSRTQYNESYMKQF